MASLDDLTAAVAAKPNLEDAVKCLVDELAARIKATSNDQNVQRFARELKQHVPALAKAVANGADASTG